MNLFNLNTNSMCRKTRNPPCGVVCEDKKTTVLCITAQTHVCGRSRQKGMSTLLHLKVWTLKSFQALVIYFLNLAA